MNAHTRSVIRASVCMAAALIAPVSFGAAASRPQVQAQLLDHAEFLCDNCFFGASTYYYCFAAGDNILVGYQKTPVLNYTDKSKNYLTPVHGGWASWTAPSQTVPLSYDDKHIWVSRPEPPPVKRNFWGHLKDAGAWVIRAKPKKQVQLTRSPLRDIFANSSRCRGTDRVSAH